MAAFERLKLRFLTIVEEFAENVREGKRRETSGLFDWEVSV